MKFITSFLLTLAVINSYAQKEKTATYSIDIEGNYAKVELAERIESHLSLKVQFNRYQVFMGPVLQLYSTDAQTDGTQPKFTGARGGVVYSLPTQSERFELLFRYEFTLQQFENNWQGTYYSDTEQDYISYRYEAEEFFSAHTLGYGFAFGISKHFKIQSVIGFGIYFSSIKDEPKSANTPNSLVYDFRGYHDFGFCWKPSAGISYTF